MKTIKLLLILACAGLSARSQQPANTTDYLVHNRSIELLQQDGKNILKFSEAPGAGLAWLKGVEFSEGTIEFDAKGRDVLQKSFIGIAFHGLDNENYETIYFRPFNFQAADPVRKIHAVQYSFEPKFGFQQLRDTQKDKYESGIRPSPAKPTEWFHVKIEIKGEKISVFVNGASDPCMEINTLNPKPTGKKIGFWVGNNSNGDFSNLKISK